MLASQMKILAQFSQKSISNRFRHLHRLRYDSLRCNNAIRQIHDNHNVPPTFFARLRSNGTPEIIIGTTILIVAGIDYTLQKRNDDDRTEMMRELERKVNVDAEITRKEMDGKMKLKTLFKCIVRQVPPSFDGHRCLTDVQVGDVLDVLEEGVGPGRQYNLCSIDRCSKENSDVSVGWFPCVCLEPIKE